MSRIGKTGKHGERAVGGAGAPPVSLYDAVTTRIIGELEAGRMPWVQPWGQGDGVGSDGPGSGGLGPAIPRNALTARRYSGVNILILWGAVIEHGYPSQSWLTFRQALEAGGGAVRKGERGTTVVYADRFVPESEKARAVEIGSDARAVSFLKRFTVFNVAQCEGCGRDLSPIPRPCPSARSCPLPNVSYPQAVSIFVSAGTGHFMSQAKISCRCRRNRPFTIRSIITGPACTS